MEGLAPGPIPSVALVLRVRFLAFLLLERGLSTLRNRPVLYVQPRAPPPGYRLAPCMLMCFRPGPYMF